MTHTQTFIIKLSLLFSLTILACKENKKDNSSSIIFANDTVKKGFQKIDIVNPNLSFTGVLNSKEVVLNLNIREDDSVFASLYNYKDEDPYKTLIYLKGIKNKNEFVLKKNDSVLFKGIVDDSVLIGKLTIKNKDNLLNLNLNKNYSNGNFLITNGEKKKKISLVGLTDKESCQGELMEIAGFEKDNFKYYLFYFIYPSTGLYKLRGSCGGGQESLIALIKVNNDVKKTKIDIIDLSSCYNGTKSLINEDDFNGKDLKNIWNQKKKLKVKRMNLRKDSSEIIIIDPEKEKIVNINMS